MLAQYASHKRKTVSQFKSEKELIKEGRRSNDFKVISDANIIMLRLFNNKPVYLISDLISCFIGKIYW